MFHPFFFITVRVVCCSLLLFCDENIRFVFS